MISPAMPCGPSALISAENSTFVYDDTVDRNKKKRYSKAKVTQSQINNYTAARIEWIRAGCPGAFHDFLS